jgi:hypothetical protein
LHLPRTVRDIYTPSIAPIDLAHDHTHDTDWPHPLPTRDGVSESLAPVCLDVCTVREARRLRREPGQLVQIRIEVGFDPRVALISSIHIVLVYYRSPIHGTPDPAMARHLLSPTPL